MEETKLNETEEEITRLKKELAEIKEAVCHLKKIFEEKIMGLKRENDFFRRR